MTLHTIAGVPHLVAVLQAPGEDAHRLAADRQLIVSALTDLGLLPLLQSYEARVVAALRSGLLSELQAKPLIDALSITDTLALKNL